jgi:hypothetical protein
LVCQPEIWKKKMATLLNASFCARFGKKFIIFPYCSCNSSFCKGKIRSRYCNPRAFFNKSTSLFRILPWRVRCRPDILFLRGYPRHQRPLQGQTQVVGCHPGYQWPLQGQAQVVGGHPGHQIPLQQAQVEGGHPGYQ